MQSGLSQDYRGGVTVKYLSLLSGPKESRGRIALNNKSSAIP